jgi:uncharacterized protein (DUF433 family)
MQTEYVDWRDGGYFIPGTRVSLDSVVIAFLQGESVQGIAECFPVLTPDRIAGALYFYQSNREFVDRYLREGRSQFEALRNEFRERNPALHAKLAAARRIPTPVS